MDSTIDLTFVVGWAGNPPPEITWLWNGKLLPPSPKIRASSTSLTLYNVTASDLGVYSCRASNALGSVHCNSTLSFESHYETRRGLEDEAHFVQLPESTVVVNKDKDLVIECRVKGHPRPKGEPVSRRNSQNSIFISLIKKTFFFAKTCFTQLVPLP